jgi:hypothetical protein
MSRSPRSSTRLFCNKSMAPFSARSKFFYFLELGIREIMEHDIFDGFQNKSFIKKIALFHLDNSHKVKGEAYLMTFFDTDLSTTYSLSLHYLE